MPTLWSRPLPLALLVLALLWLLVWLPRRVVPARSLALFRCLLPSWRFFEQIEPVPALHYRAAPHGDDWGEWQAALITPARTPISLWLNAAGNLHLACRSLVEHLVADLEEAAELGAAPVHAAAPELAAAPVLAAPLLQGAEPALEGATTALVSYRLVRALVEQRVRAGLPPSPGLRYQFRLVDGDLTEPLFLSGVHALP